jgi:transposase-like protein
LTASTLLPDVLQPGRFEQYQQELQRDYPPSSVLERILLAEVARHSAALEVGQKAEGAVLRQGALSVGQLILTTMQDPAAQEDFSLAAAVSTDSLDRFARYRRGHERALFTAIKKLQELRDTKQSGAAEDSRASAPAFLDEKACHEYLKQRLVGNSRCPHCGGEKGSWLVKRQRWQCAGCHRQVGPTAGTVMAGSRLPLTQWFAAIRVLLCHPGTTVSELAQEIGVRRMSTVRSVVKSIRAAIGSDKAQELLAGLDRLFQSRPAAQAESCASQHMDSAKRTRPRSAQAGGHRHVG